MLKEDCGLKRFGFRHQSKSLRTEEESKNEFNRRGSLAAKEELIVFDLMI